VDECWAASPLNIEHVDDSGGANLLQLLADGLWTHDYVHETPLTPSQRKVLTDAILQLLSSLGRDNASACATPMLYNRGHHRPPRRRPLPSSSPHECVTRIHCRTVPPCAL